MCVRYHYNLPCIVNKAKWLHENTIYEIRYLHDEKVTREINTCYKGKLTFYIIKHNCFSILCFCNPVLIVILRW